jgi:hypothetical protein
MYPQETREEFTSDFCPCEDEFLLDRGYYAWGSSIETTYDLFGIFSMADEHWNMPDYDKDGSVTEEERFKWNDEEMDGKMFIPWHPYDHPTLGEVEIGGWRWHKASPPEGELIQKECEMGNNYVIYLAGLAPRVAVGEVKIVDKKGGIFQVDISVKNTGFLPTATEQAQSLGTESVVLQVEPNDNVEILFGEEKVKLGQIWSYSASPKTTFILRVKDSSKKAVLKATVKSQKAGTDTKEIVVR